jgi:hypothetical protein
VELPPIVPTVLNVTVVPSVLIEAEVEKTPGVSPALSRSIGLRSHGEWIAARSQAE